MSATQKESQLQGFGVTEKCASFKIPPWNLKLDHSMLLTLTPVAWYCWDAGNLTWCHFLSEQFLSHGIHWYDIV